MGMTTIKMQVSNVAHPRKSETIKLLVDSGAVYSVVPTKILQKLKIRPISTEEFELADGRTIKRRKGVALFRYKDKVGGADVIFGEDGDSNLLGAFTLEALGLSLDPLKRELNPLPMLLPTILHKSR